MTSPNRKTTVRATNPDTVRQLPVEQLKPAVDNAMGSVSSLSVADMTQALAQALAPMVQRLDRLDSMQPTTNRSGLSAALSLDTPVAASSPNGLNGMLDQTENLLDTVENALFRLSSHLIPAASVDDFPAYIQKTGAVEESPIPVATSHLMRRLYAIQHRLATVANHLCVMPPVLPV